MFIDAMAYARIPAAVKAASFCMGIFGKKAGSLHGGHPPADFLDAPDYAYRAAVETTRAWYLHLRAMRVRKHTLYDHVAKNILLDDGLRDAVAASKGRSIIISTPHYGPFLDGALWMLGLSSAERPLQIFYDPPTRVDKNASFDKLFERFPERVEVLHNDNRGVIGALKRLRSGSILGIMPDVLQEPEKSVCVPFCNRMYPAMQGTAFLALKSNALIVTMYAQPDPESTRTKLLTGRTIDPSEFTIAGDEDQTVFEITRALYADFDAQLRKEPWHWAFWDNVHRYGPAELPDSLYSLNDGRRLLAKRSAQTPELTRQVSALEDILKSIQAAEQPLP
jgi:lauroyl/myristoyl acyltransferase